MVPPAAAALPASMPVNLACSITAVARPVLRPVPFAKDVFTMPDPGVADLAQGIDRACNSANSQNCSDHLFLLCFEPPLFRVSSRPNLPKLWVVVLVHLIAPFPSMHTLSHIHGQKTKMRISEDIRFHAFANARMANGRPVVALP